MTATLASTDSLVAAFAEGVGHEGPIAVEGKRTRWSVGGSPDEGTRFVTAPEGIIDYAPEEMTVRVRAGTTTAELNEALAERHQRTALAERGGTIGGALAVGENDLLALGVGMVRTSLLLVRYISAEGRIITSGGPTVKNVTGFDLPRLMVGSLGTLGLVAEVILRTNPIPAVSRWLVAEGVDARVTYEHLIAPSAVLGDGSSTWVLLEGHGVDVDAQQRALHSVGDFVEADDGRELPPHRWSLSGADAGKLVAGTSSHDTGRFLAALGLGLVFAERPQPPRPLAPEIAVVGERLKQNFDPGGRLNPGRNPGRK